MIVSMGMLRRRIAIMNKELRQDFHIDHSYGGYRVVNNRESHDVSPRLKKAELIAWLEGFFACMYKQY